MEQQVIGYWTLSNSHSLNVYEDLNGEALVIGYEPNETEQVEIKWEEKEDGEDLVPYINWGSVKFYLDECMRVR